MEQVAHGDDEISKTFVRKIITVIARKGHFICSPSMNGLL